MMNWFRKSKGYISIFLCLLLLPMVTYSAMIIDASRLQSARVAISSAGDLTMNAALSEYEQVLEDMYGLFAVTQAQSSNPAEYEKNMRASLEAYFTQTIENRIISGETKNDYYVQNFSKDLVDMIFNDQTSEKDFTNFLQMRVEDFNYSPVAGSALANPAVLKRQIIDYMKYKGPVSLVTTLMPKLEFLKDSSKQTEALEKKVEYTKALSDIEDPCEQVYYLIEGNDEMSGYNEKVATYNLYIRDKTISTALSNLRDHLNNMSECYLFYKNNPIKEALTYDKLLSGASVITSKYDFKMPENTEKFTADDYKNLLQKLAGRLLTDSDNVLLGFKYKSDEFFLDYDDSDKLKPVIKLTVSEQSGNICSIVNLRSDGKWRKGLNVDANSGKPIVDQLKDRFDLQNELYSYIGSVQDFVGYYSSFMQLKSKYEELFILYREKFTEEFKKRYGKDEDDETFEDLLEKEMENDPYYPELNRHMEAIRTVDKRLRNSGYERNLKSFLSDLSDNNVYYTYYNLFQKNAGKELKTYYIYINYMISNLNEIYQALGKIVSAIENAERSKQQWETAINNIESESTKASMKSDYGTTTYNLSMDSLNEFRDLITGFRITAENLIKQLQSVKYMDTQVIKNISSTTDYKNNPLYDNYSDAKTSQAILAAVAELDKTFDASGVAPWTFDAFKKIDGEGEAEGFYKTIKSICNPVEPTNKENKKKELKKLEEYSKTKDGTPDAEAADKIQNEADAVSNSGNKKTESNEKKASEDFNVILNGSGNVKGIKQYCKENQENVQKNIESYTVSGVDVPKSGKVNKKNDPAQSLGAAKKLLNQIGRIVGTIGEYAYLEEYFTEMFTCQTDTKIEDGKLLMLNGYTNNQPGGAAKTLNQNTEWYGKEIEYIIWGDPDLEKNIQKNEVLIYTIRFALNAIYAFTASDIQLFAFEAATAIAGWTVIGVPIVQACITIALALAESAWDLKQLKDGKDVPIYKNSRTFVCSPTGALVAVTTEIVENAVNKLEKKLEKTVDSIIDNAAEKGIKTVSDAADFVESCVDDYIDEQVEQVRFSIQSQFVTPIINQITPVLTLVNSGAGDIKTLVDKGVKEAFNTIEKNINSMNDGIIKELALEFLNEIRNDTGIINEIESYLTNIQSVTDPGNLTDLLIGKSGIITNKLNEFRDKIESKLDSFGKKMKNELKSTTDKSVNDLKSVLHEKMNNVAAQISGTTNDFIGDIAGSAVKSIDASASSGGFSLNYKEYCKIFMFMNLPFNETNMLQRTAVLIQANIRHATSNSNSSFEMVKANTLVSVNAKVKMGTLFPWMVQDNLNDATGQSGLELDFSDIGSNYVVINYSGINGY